MENTAPIVLIVDDDDILCVALAYDFKKIGFHVLKANSTKEAMEIIQTQTIQLVITDIRMPGESGIELLNKIRNKNQTLPPVIIMTGYTELNLADAKKWGADAVFSKPLDRKALLERSQEVVAGVIN